MVTNDGHAKMLTLEDVHIKVIYDAKETHFEKLLTICEIVHNFCINWKKLDIEIFRSRVNDFQLLNIVRPVFGGLMVFMMIFFIHDNWKFCKNFYNLMPARSKFLSVYDSVNWVKLWALVCYTMK